LGFDFGDLFSNLKQNIQKCFIYLIFFFKRLYNKFLFFSSLNKKFAKLWNFWKKN